MKPKAKEPPSHKRVVRDDNSEEDSNNKPATASNHLVHKAKKKARKQPHTMESESDEEVETVDKIFDPPEKEIEEVEDIGEQGPYYECWRLTIYYEDSLNSHQHGAELQEKPTKKDLMLDLLTIMTD